MNSLTAAELKRRGFAALDVHLLRGPVRITRHNKPAAVVLSEADYAALARTAPDTASETTALQWLLNQSAGTGKVANKTAKQSKAQIDRRLRQERDSWA